MWSLATGGGVTRKNRKQPHCSGTTRTRTHLRSMSSGLRGVRRFDPAHRRDGGLGKTSPNNSVARERGALRQHNCSSVLPFFHPGFAHKSLVFRRAIFSRWDDTSPRRYWKNGRCCQVGISKSPEKNCGATLSWGEIKSRLEEKSGVPRGATHLSARPPVPRSGRNINSCCKAPRSEQYAVFCPLAPAGRGAKLELTGHECPSSIRAGGSHLKNAIS